MIEKLPFTEIHTGGEDMVDRVEFRPVAPYEMQHKINELVDAVNGILDYAPLEMAMKAEPEPDDPYTKQRKWIGCLVEYGNSDDGFKYGILTNIEPIFSAYPFEIDNGRDATADCWLPSKTIFYKGGDNE